ncbi:GGDEF domain-containing protein, partial [Vibrio anguillarum]|nr:GGDEF domain-containing protein [Vibrio anguillarum]
MTQVDGLSLTQFQDYFFRSLDIIPLPIVVSQGIISTIEGDNNRQHLYFNQTFVKELGYTIQDIPDISTWFTTVYPDPEYRQEVALRWE